MRYFFVILLLLFPGVSSAEGTKDPSQRWKELTGQSVEAATDLEKETQTKSQRGNLDDWRLKNLERMAETDPRAKKQLEQYKKELAKKKVEQEKKDAESLSKKQTYDALKSIQIDDALIEQVKSAFFEPPQGWYALDYSKLVDIPRYRRYERQRDGLYEIRRYQSGEVDVIRVYSRFPDWKDKARDDGALNPYFKVTVNIDPVTNHNEYLMHYQGKHVHKIKNDDLVHFNGDPGMFFLYTHRSISSVISHDGYRLRFLSTDQLSREEIMMFANLMDYNKISEAMKP